MQEKGGLSVYAASQICSKESGQVVSVKLETTNFSAGQRPSAEDSSGSPIRGFPRPPAHSYGIRI
jgi:hypothetical protein